MEEKLKDLQVSLLEGAKNLTEVKVKAANLALAEAEKAENTPDKLGWVHVIAKLTEGGSNG